MDLLSCSFACMTTDIELFVATDEPQAAGVALEAAEQFMRSVEARFSRFRDDSELAHLNRAAGQSCRVSPDLCELVETALAASRLSQGIFDPTVIDALEAAGYDRSIELIRDGTPFSGTPSQPGEPSSGTASETKFGRWRDIGLDLVACSVTLPAGMRLDLGGIAKGWAVDRTAASLRAFGTGLVNAGGDLCAWGDQPGAEPGQGWLAAVDNPHRPGSDVAWLWVKDAALATSSTAARRWCGGHHLIDPRTGRPAETDLVSVTVLAPQTAQCEIAAKTVLILGRKAGLAWLAAQAGVEALLISDNGDLVTTSGLGHNLVPVEPAVARG